MLYRGSRPNTLRAQEEDHRRGPAALGTAKKPSRIRRPRIRLSGMEMETVWSATESAYPARTSCFPMRRCQRLRRSSALSPGRLSREEGESFSTASIRICPAGVGTPFIVPGARFEGPSPRPMQPENPRSRFLPSSNGTVQMILPRSPSRPPRSSGMI